MSSKEISMSFKKVDRSYRTPPGMRLATFKEVEDNIESIKQQDLLEQRDRARLLDGWISGPCYNFQMGNNFKYCMGYMLVIQVHAQTNSSSRDSGKELYKGVSLTEEGKQVALLLCAYDWNYEVVYWLLNSWDGTQIMDPQDVRDGTIPFNTGSDFDDTIGLNNLNNLVNDLARNLGETSVGDKANNEKLTLGIVKNVLLDLWTSSSQNLTEAHKKLLGRKFQNLTSFFSQEVGDYWFHAFESHRDSGDSLWNLMWEHFCTFLMVCSTQTSFEILINKWLKDKSPHVTTSQKNFIISGSILYYITQLHEKFLYEEHSGPYNILEKFITITCDGNFNVLDQILHVAVGEGDVIISKKMLDCGAHALSQTPQKQTALHVAFDVAFEKDDKIEAMVKILLDKCDAKEQLANTPDEEGKTVLHVAAYRGNSKLCRLLIDYGAKADAKDNRGRLPLHYAVEREEDKTIDVLINVSDQKSIEMLEIKDSDGRSPLDIAVVQNNIKLMAKLLPILKQPPESYFNNSKLLRQFAFEGNTDIVGKLLQGGASPLDVDEEGKTALHYAAMCENYIRSGKTIDLILEKCQDRKSLISKLDGKGKTALHVAALNGNTPSKFEDLIDKKDRDGRNPLYDAIQGEPDDPTMVSYITSMMEEKDISLDELIDTTGLTPLHMAASQGKVLQVDVLLRQSRNPKKYVKRPDYMGQTALHKAAKGGHEDTIKVLLHWGAQPLLERDCDGRTALHYAVQTKTGDDGITLAKLLLKKCGSEDRQLLFLWASAAGLGTADEILSRCPLKEFLLAKKKKPTSERNNLLQTAACMGDTEMTKELLRRGCQIADIQDEEWTKSLQSSEDNNVKKVRKEIQMIVEQGNDRPSLSDNLGRADFAHGLAALLLNPYLKPPIAVGISGSWGMGKSSLMVQTEIILLKTAAQSALLPTFKSPSSNLPGVQEFELSEVGKKRYNEVKRWVQFLRNKSKFHTNFIKAIKEGFPMWITALTKRKNNESQRNQPEDDSLDNFLNNYEPEYHKIFKSLAAIDSSDMFIPKRQQLRSRSDSPSEGSVPAILTVQYNAWKYRNESEALAGMAVEITKEMEGLMTKAQWLSTCWRNTWRKQKQTIWIEVIFPCLLAIFLAGTFTWIVWLLLDRYNVKESEKLKYGSLPATIVIMVWTLVKSVMSTVKPVSTQWANYIKFPDHTENLGYQERVISDIKFLKGEIRKKPYFPCTAASCIWHLITRCCMISYLCSKFFQETMPNSKAPSTSTSYANNHPRIIVFVDDLDRCRESVILQVLSAINLVLAECEISAIVGMDKALIQRAIIKEYGGESLQNNKELVDKYLQKIIQLPLDLPDPSEDESKTFLKRQLGVFSKQQGPETETDVHDDSESEKDPDYAALFSTFDHNVQIEGLGDRLDKMFSAGTLTPGETKVVTQMERDSHPQTDAGDEVAIDMINENGANTKSYEETSALQREGKALLGTDAGDQSSSQSIPIREWAFVRYSEGEKEAFCYFETMDTDWRKLPRQWKCLLYYHRLIWYIFSMSDNARSLDGWQVQLISWIFICWEWEENMNILIQNWDRIDILKTCKSESRSSGPSLGAIVEHYMKNKDKDEKMSDSGDDKHKAQVSEASESKEIKAKEELKEKNVSKNSTQEMKAEKSKDDLKEKGISNNTENPESSNREPVQLEAIDKEEMVIMPDSQADVSERSEEGDTTELLEHSKDKDTPSEKLGGGMKEKDVSNNAVNDDESSNKVVDKLKEVVKDQMITLREEIEKALMELAKVKKEIRDLKETKQQTEKNKKSVEEEETRRRNWRRMRKALKKYDVSMKAIQAFQRFRFYCVPGYLPWPLPKEEDEDS